MTTAVFTGGGTAGHVTPNLALMKRLLDEGFSISYIGSKDGLEEALVRELGIPFYGISAGKLRRYASLKNISDAFRVLKGLLEARKLLIKLKPDVLFSKGGYVSVPVVLGAKGICPVVCHESDYSPGLSTKIAARYAKTMCVSFSDTLGMLKREAVFTGSPVRPELYKGSALKGRALCGFNGEKPVLLVIGGSQGSQAINEALSGSLSTLLKKFDIAHICGKGKLCNIAPLKGYAQFEYVTDDLKHLLAMADIVLSRAGANTIFELLALKKPNLLIPLPASSSRGDQLQNAAYFEKKGFSKVLNQSALTKESLSEALNALHLEKARYIKQMSECKNADGTEAVLNEIRKAAKK